MSTPVASPPLVRTIADLLESLGHVPATRVRFHPLPGTATVRDVVEVERRENRLCELVDGVLVEKAMGFRESLLGVALSGYLRAFAEPRNLGLIAGADGMIQLFPGLVRIPDVAFVSWARVPGGRVPREPVPELVPDLAVEILSAGNTPEEMARKCREYFSSGVRMVWIVDPEARTVTVHSSPGEFQTLGETDTLAGVPALPGFTLAVRELFAALDRQGKA